MSETQHSGLTGLCVDGILRDAKQGSTFVGTLREGGRGARTGGNVGRGVPAEMEALRAKLLPEARDSVGLMGEPALVVPNPICFDLAEAGSYGAL